MKRIVPILLIILCVVTTAQADIMYVLCRPDDHVNMRFSASTKSEIVGYLDCGDEVETDGVVKKDNKGRKWIHIVSPCVESGDSWVCSMYLQESRVTIQKCSAYVIAKGRTALRRSPNGKRIKWLENGDEVSIIAMSNEWALTSKGYVKMDYLEGFYE